MKSFTQLNRREIIRQYLEEAVGVPENLHQTAESVYKKIVNYIGKISKEDFKNQKEFTTSLRGNFRIADYEFSTIKLNVRFERDRFDSKPYVSSMAILAVTKRNEDFSYELVKNKTLNMNMIISIPSRVRKFSDILDSFEIRKNDFITQLNHELKHSYDNFKMKYLSPQKRSIYDTIVKYRSGIHSIDNFLFEIYYTDSIENLVRSSEIASQIRSNKISKKEFLEFLTDTETYRSLKSLKDFTFEDFIDKLEEDMYQIEDFLDKNNINVKKLSKEEKIKAVLEIIYSQITFIMIQTFISRLGISVLDFINGLEGQKDKMIKSFSKKVTKFKNAEDFFKYYIKQFNYVGDQMIRKIAKVYSLAKD